MSERSAVVIDGRLFQTAAWNRGMGRYTLALLGGLAGLPKAPRIVVVFSAELPFEYAQQEAVTNAVNGVEQHVLPILNGASREVEDKNKSIFDNFLDAHGLQEALFLQTSLFTFEYAPVFPTHTTNACIFYDMIPFKFWDLFSGYFAEHEYFRRYRFLYEVDKIFAISKSVKQDLMNYLGFDDDQIENISGADINAVRAGRKSFAKRDYKYILLPGGDAPHKNMLRAIKGFDLFNAKKGDEYKLLIPSTYSPENQRRMNDLSPNINLLGQVSDEELDNLYENAELILFPSLDEGLGLPILEAVRYGKKIACSNVPIFKEISTSAFHFFDPYSPESIAKAIREAMDDNDRAGRYDNIRSQFTWQKSAATLWSTDIQKNTLNQNDEHAIVVEQDKSFELTRQMSAVVGRFYKTAHIQFFIDLLDEAPGVPLIFNHIFPARDIADAFNRTKPGKRSLILTPKSKYTNALVTERDDVHYVNTMASKVEAAFKKAFEAKK